MTLSSKVLYGQKTVGWMRSRVINSSGTDEIETN